MESEFLAPSTSTEEVMMPVESITNGGGAATNEDLGVVEYLEENDPMMADNEPRAAPGSKSAEAEEVAEEGDEVERKPTQLVPKKRKDAAILAEGEEDDEQDEEDGEAGDDDNNKSNIKNEEDEELLENEEEKPTSSTRAVNNNNSKDNNVDEDQCRVCTAKEDLVSLFKKVEKLTVAELLMTICPTVSIARKDFMPQYICNPCLDNVTIATQLKTQCETTERELRKKLSRSKNKVRRPTGYVVINAHSDSDPPTDEEPSDDVEFKVSDVEVSSAPENDDSDDSDFNSQKPVKKRRSRGGGTAGGGGVGRGRGGRRKSAVATPQLKKPAPAAVEVAKKRGRPPPTKRQMPESDDEQPIPIESLPKKKKKKPKQRSSSDVEEVRAPSPEKPPIEYPCDECEQVFTRKLSLVLHKKSHAGGREPINCEVCGKQFKIQGAYRTHLERHKNDTETTGFPCGKCETTCGTKGELRRHLAEEHDEPGMLHECGKCKRTFVSESRLERHKDGRCPGREMPAGASGAKHKKSSAQQDQFEGFAVGKDLFKSVAPLTSTYWSDSFSD